MDYKKINIQMHMEELFNTCEVGECFEDRDELVEFRKEVHKLIDEINEYERDNFFIK